jgi:hypothetical protein
MTDIKDRLTASLKYDAINGDERERAVVASQIKEAIAALAEKDEIIENKSRVIVGWENHVFKKDGYNKKLLDENIDYQNENAAQREQIAALTAHIKELTEAVEKIATEHCQDRIKIAKAALTAQKEAKDE